MFDNRQNGNVNFVAMYDSYRLLGSRDASSGALPGPFSIGMALANQIRLSSNSLKLRARQKEINMDPKQ